MLRKIKETERFDSQNSFAYDGLYNLISTVKSFPVELMLGNDKGYFEKILRDVMTLPEGEYRYLMNAIKKVRELAILSREVLYRRLTCDIVNLSHPDYKSFLEEVELVRTETLGTIKIPYIHLICDIVSLPENLYGSYLSMLEDLRNEEKEIENNG